MSPDDEALLASIMDETPVAWVDSDPVSSNCAVCDVSQMAFLATRTSLPQAVQTAQCSVTLEGWSQGIQSILQSLKGQMKWLDVTLVVAKLAAWSPKISKMCNEGKSVQRTAREICKFNEITFPVMGAKDGIHVLDMGMSTIYVRPTLVCGWSRLWISMHIQYWTFESVEDFVRAAGGAPQP